MLKIQTIVHPTDFSASSAYAFRMACALASQHGARLVVVHVMPLPSAVGPEGLLLAPPPAEYKEELEAELRELKPTDPGLQVTYCLEEGVVADEILRVAKNWNANMIVMGTHGRTGLSRMLMGSAAEQVVRRASCPVLTVKSPPAKDDAIEDEKSVMASV